MQRLTPSERLPCDVIRRHQGEYFYPLCNIKRFTLSGASSIIHSLIHSFSLRAENEMDCDCFAVVMEADVPKGYRELRMMKAQCVFFNWTEERGVCV